MWKLSCGQSNVETLETNDRLLKFFPSSIPSLLGLVLD